MNQDRQPNPQLITLGHDLNNVWAGLLGCTEVLQITIPSDAPEQEHIQMLLDGINQGEQITQKISAIAHAHSLSDHHHPPEADIIHLDSSAVSLTNPTLDQDHRQLEQLAAELTQAETAHDAHAIIIKIYRNCLHHFYQEEQIISQCPDYPFHDHHHDTHCALLKQLQQLEAHCSAENTTIANIKDEIQQIAILLPVHILGMDAGMAPHLAAKPELTNFHYTLPDDATLTQYFDLSLHNTNGLI